jgi:formyl-CoA transferase
MSAEAFRSLTVLSLEQAMALPFLTQRLAEEGMRVIRVERPGRGDPNRWVGPPLLPDTEPGMNAYYLPNNLGKQAITLNLREPEGQALLAELIERLPVDIFATNQRPGSYTRLGIDYERLSRVRPALIWVGITGFGPDHDEAAYDPILQARAGFMDLTGDPAGDPMVFGLPMVDLGAAEHAFGEVMKALYLRAVTGRGSRIDISMYQSAVSWMVSPVMLSLCTSEQPTRRGNTHPFFAPVSVYPTRDGHLYLAVGNDEQWQALTGLPGFQRLARREYERNAGRIAQVEGLSQELAAITREFETDELMGCFTGAGIPVSKVNRIAGVCADPLISDRLVRARDRRTGVEISISPPPVISDFLRASEMRLDFPPRLGEHNAEVYGALGHDANGLQAQGLI